MSLLKRLTDRLVLWPSTEPIDSGELQRELIPVGSGHLEAWTTHWNREADRKVLLIKFPGNAGRAERATPNPAHLWDGVSSEVWAINPFGYGGSTGPATLQRYPEMVDAVYNSLRPRFPEHKLVVYGRSLGSLSALAMAAKYPVDGLYLRDPVPIHQLISTRPRYAWPSLGLSRLFAMQIPKRLNAVVNSKNCNAACLFVTSGRDTLVPPKYQAKIINGFGGPKRVFVLPDADHNDSIPDELETENRSEVEWLIDQVF